MSVPARTHEQRLAALNRANQVRSKRRDLKADMRFGRRHLADVLFSNEDWLRSMRIRDLLLATPGIGPLKAARALQACWLSPTVSLHRTSRKSREKVLDWLDRTHPSVNVGEWAPETSEEVAA